MSILLAVVLLGALILIHEAGHFLAALWVGIRPTVFSVGFGRALWQYRARSGVTYQVGRVPLGGFVRFLDRREDGAAPGAPFGMLDAPRGARAVVLVAGVLANVVAAYLLFVVAALSAGNGWSSLAIGGQVVRQGTSVLVSTIGQLVTGGVALSNVSGPVGIVSATATAARTGLSAFCLLGGLVSLNLAVVNLLPIPVMDGGQLILLALEAVRGRMLSARAHRFVLRLGLGMVGALFLLGTGNDLLALARAFHLL